MGYQLVEVLLILGYKYDDQCTLRLLTKDVFQYLLMYSYHGINFEYHFNTKSPKYKLGKLPYSFVSDSAGNAILLQYNI
jgi:hypothetical protein